MGNLTSVLGTLTSTLGAVQTIGSAFDKLSGKGDDLSRAYQNQAMRDLQRQQAQQVADTTARAETERQKITLDSADAEKRRIAALKRSIAKRNARFGATGVGGTGGSREAVLLGLYNESDDEKKQREELDKLRFSSIDNDLSSLASRNILQKTQLSERQKLDRIADSY